MRITLPNWSAGLWCLQLSAFLTNLGFFMLIPLLAVHFTTRLGISLTMAGTLYSVRLLAQSGLMLFGGIVADRVGYRETIVIGSIIRAIGFAMFGFTDSLPMLFLAGILAGLGGALFSPAWNAATAELSTPQNREQVFAWRNIFANAGLTIGPMVGAWMSNLDIFAWICYASAFIFLFFGFLVQILVPKMKVSKRELRLLADIKHITDNRAFLWLTFWLMGFTLLYQQMYMVIPVLAQDQAGKDISGYLFTGLAVLIIFLQQPISHLIERRHWKPFPVMAAGMVMLGFSFVPAAFHISLLTVILPVVGMAFASMFIQPISQTWISDIADRDLVASFFGFFSLSAAIGGTVGNSGGGWIVDFALASGHTQLPFIVFSLIGIICAAGILFSNRVSSNSAVNPKLRNSVSH